MSQRTASEAATGLLVDSEIRVVGRMHKKMEVEKQSLTMQHPSRGVHMDLLKRKSLVLSSLKRSARQRMSVHLLDVSI